MVVVMVVTSYCMDLSAKITFGDIMPSRVRDDVTTANPGLILG